MKILHLLRHAKSSWSQPGLADRDRALNKRGRRDAPRIGRALAERIEPMTIAASRARRAQLTLEGLCIGWPAIAKLTHRQEEALYTFSDSDVADWIRAQDDSLSSLFIIGHNPAFTCIINTLCGTAALDNLPTAGYARLNLGIESWRDLRRGCAQLDELLLPRHLEE